MLAKQDIAAEKVQRLTEMVQEIKERKSLFEMR
jgi:hypothetical protein